MGPGTNGKSDYLPQRIDTSQAKDSGLAIVLILLLAGYFWQEFVYILLAVIVLIIAMAVPVVFWPFAKLWLGLSILLGTVISKIILSLVFFIILTPVGVIRRLLGADSLQCKQWKKGRSSVFRVRNHRYEPDEIEKPY